MVQFLFYELEALLSLNLPRGLFKLLRTHVDFFVDLFDSVLQLVLLAFKEGDIQVLPVKRIWKKKLNKMFVRSEYTLNSLVQDSS